jgi:hypothetical protein
MYSAQTLGKQMVLQAIENTREMTVFTPPGIVIETARYPTVLAGVLGSTNPSKHISIFNHPEAWQGLDREALLTMRRSLYRFVLPLDARTGRPEGASRTLQKIALSVNPLALGVEGPTLPPRRLQSQAGLLPTSPRVQVKSINLLTEPEISTVAERITQMDIPAAEGIWRLFDYDYTLDQVARIMAVGLLGKHGSRRFVPLHGAYKAVIDSFVSRAILELSETEQATDTSVQMAGHLDSLVTVVSRPGPPRVDYLQLDETANPRAATYSLESPEHAPTDAKTALYADHARFVIYKNMLCNKQSSHITVFHHVRDSKDAILGPWTVRAAIENALDSKLLKINSDNELVDVLNTILGNNVARWVSNIPVLKRIPDHRDENLVYPL